MDSAAFRRRALLGVAEMYAADKAAMAAGIAGETLMEAAGRGVADCAGRKKRILSRVVHEPVFRVRAQNR